MAIPKIRAVVIRADYVSGKPDFQLPNEGYLDDIGSSWVACFEDPVGTDHLLSVRDFGNDGTTNVFVGWCTKDAIASIGATADSLKNDWGVPAYKSWLQGKGVTEVGGNPIAPHVPSGWPAVAVGKDDDG